MCMLGLASRLSRSARCGRPGRGRWSWCGRGNVGRALLPSSRLWLRFRESWRLAMRSTMAMCPSRLHRRLSGHRHKSSPSGCTPNTKVFLRRTRRTVSLSFSFPRSGPTDHRHIHVRTFTRLCLQTRQPFLDFLWDCFTRGICATCFLPNVLRAILPKDNVLFQRCSWGLCSLLIRLQTGFQGELDTIRISNGRHSS